MALTEEPLQQPNVEQDELRLNSQAIKCVEINQLQYRRPTEEQVAPSAAGRLEQVPRAIFVPVHTREGVP